MTTADRKLLDEAIIKHGDLEDCKCIIVRERKNRGSESKVQSLYSENRYKCPNRYK